MRMRTRSTRLIVLSATVAVAAGTWAGVAYTGSGQASSGVRHGQGVGLYTDSSVANQTSTFTINRTLVSCGVGTTGVFEMLMYSTRIRHYSVNSTTKEITARGEMRSITRSGGSVVEDVRHPFIAHALDANKDRFDVHFTTPFWNPGNPLCTPSTRYPGLCRFGGEVFAGDVNVSSGGGD